MIKGISFLRPVANRNAYDRLTGFFQALGLENGRGWEETPLASDELPPVTPKIERGASAPASAIGGASRGASFIAPLGNVEFIEGRMPPFAEIAVEVTSLDAAHQAATGWFRGEGLDPAASVSELAETHWQSS